MINFSFSDEQRSIRDAVLSLCSGKGKFGDGYWLQKDRDGDYPLDFHAEMARLGWIGIAMPEAYGGSTWYHRGIHPDAGRKRIRCRNVGRGCDPPQHLWP